MAQLSVQKFKDVGLSPSFVAASGTGDTFLNAYGTHLFIKNDGTASITVTIPSVNQCSHGFSHDGSYTVGVGATLKISTLNAERFNDENNNVTVNYSAVTSVTVAVIQA